MLLKQEQDAKLEHSRQLQKLVDGARGGGEGEGKKKKNKKKKKKKKKKVGQHTHTGTGAAVICDRTHTGTGAAVICDRVWSFLIPFDPFRAIFGSFRDQT